MIDSARLAEVMATTSVSAEEGARSVRLAMRPVVEKSCRDFAHLCQVIDEVQQDGSPHHTSS